MHVHEKIQYFTSFRAYIKMLNYLTKVNNKPRAKTLSQNVAVWKLVPDLFRGARSPRCDWMQRVLVAVEKPKQFG